MILTMALMGCQESDADTPADPSTFGTDSGPSPTSPGSTPGSATQPTAIPRTPTFHRDIRPLLEANCVGCHSPGQIAPFALDTPEAMLQLKELVVYSIEERTMPPWGMHADCHDTEGNLQLSDEEVLMVMVWRDQGFEVGDEADYVPPVIEPPADIGPPDIVLTPAEEYTPNDAVLDDYRCLPVEAPLDRDLFVTGLDVQPGNVGLVHHVLVYAIPPAGIPELEALDAADAEPGYTCFGTSGLDQAQTVGGWVPGNDTNLYGDGIAQRIPEGSRLVLQMHYNTAVGVDAPDRTSVHLWTLPDGEVPEQLMTVFPIPKLSLDIEAGDANSVQTARQRLPIPEGSVVFATAPHMHLLGTSLQSKVIRSDGSEQCLSRIDRWDFNWQRTYGIPEGQRVPLSVHDEVEITCTYDNSAANQPTVNGEPRTPEDVGWGDGSYDEMCLDYVALLRPYSGDGGSGTCAEYDLCMEGCASGDGICATTCMTASGEACLYCGLDGLFGDCVGTEHCPLQGLSLLSCMNDCAEHYEDQFACLYEECRGAFDTYMACAEGPLSSGACVGDFVGCEDIAQ
jgi:hypothetical protein